MIATLLWVLALWTMPLQAAPRDCEQAGYLVGAAVDDITGPIVGVGMMGYAELSQVDEGLHMRVRSRVLVVSDACQQATVALVSDDLGMVFHSVKAAVIARLAVQLPGVFDYSNVLLSATHSHSGPGGFAHHALYNITTGGFQPENFAAIVDGTVRAIVRAYQQRRPAQLAVREGELAGAQFNRSPEAYAANPAEERRRYLSNTDQSMVLPKSDGGRRHADRGV